MRRFFLVTHRWVGLAAAIVLTIAGLTGLVLVWSRSPGLEQFHTHLALDEFGEWLVNGSAIAFVFLALGGFVLWWRRKILAVRGGKGWWRLLFDLHHALGMFGAALTLLIAISGIGIMMNEDDESEGARSAAQIEASRESLEKTVWFRLHTAREYPAPLQILWAAGSLSFVVQAFSGFLMWWKPQKASVAD